MAIVPQASVRNPGPPGAMARAVIFGNGRWLAQGMYQMRMEQAWVPPRYRDCRLEHFPESLPVGWPDLEEGKSYYIHGPAGSGKTHLLCAMVREQVSRQHVYFGSVDDYLDRIKRSYDAPETEKAYDEERDELVDRRRYVEDDLIGARILAIDDLGVGQVTQWGATMLARIINKRYEDMTPIWVTSNLDLDRLADQYDVRVARRLAEMCVTVEMKLRVSV